MDKLNDGIVLKTCIEKLADENITITNLKLCDIPTAGVYLFVGQDTNGKDIAFELSMDPDGKATDLVPCLTIDSIVHFYDTMGKLSRDWHKHDLVNRM